MYKKAVAPLLIIVVLVCGIVAYQTLEQRSIDAPPQATATFRVLDWTGTSSGAEIRMEIQAQALNDGVTVAQIVQDPKDPRSSRILHASDQLNVPADFGRLMSTNVVVGNAPSTLSPIGEWSGWGPIDGIEAVVSGLASNGITAEIISEPQSLPSLTALPASLVQVYASLVLFVIGLGVATVISTQRALAVQQLHGATLTVKLWRALASPLVAVIIAGVALSMAEAIYCLVAYDGAYIVEFVGQTLLLLGVLVVVLSASIALATFLYHQIDPLPALGGATPGRTLLLSSWVLHGVLLIVVASLGATALGANDRFESFSNYGNQIRAERLSVPQFGGVYTQEQENEAGRVTAKWITDLDTQGEGLVARHQSLLDGAQSFDVFYINEEYLERHAPASSIDTGSPNAVTVYRPTQVSQTAMDIAIDDIAFTSHSSSSSIDVVEVEHTGTFPTLTMPALSTNHVVTSLENPILVVLPRGSRATAKFALSGDGFYILDGEKVLSEASNDPEITRYLRSITPLDSLVDQTIAVASGERAMAIAALVVGILALVIVTMTGVISYGQYARKRLEIQFLFGWKLSSMYLWFIVLEFFALAALGWWFVREVGRHRSEQESYILTGLDGSVVPVYAAPAALIALVISIIVFVGTTALVHTRMVKKGAVQ